MSEPLVPLEKLRRALKEACPYIIFAITDKAVSLKSMKSLELWVYTEPNHDYYKLLEKILEVVERTIPCVECELLVLNQVDLRTRSRAAIRKCLFIREGSEGIYWKYFERIGQERRAGKLHPKLWSLLKASFR